MKDYFKKVFVLVLIFLYLVTETLVAVVTDNDGSAFITNELSAYLIQFNFSY